jgi:hypothetical protein
MGNVPLVINHPHMTTLVNTMAPRPSGFAINSAPRRVAKPQNTDQLCDK